MAPLAVCMNIVTFAGKLERAVTMSNEKLVILARPHPFIADSMKALLSRNGYTPMAIEDFNIIETLPREAIMGAVISTSVVAEGGNIEEIFGKVRHMLPEVPIVFATLLETDQAISMLSAELAACMGAPKFIPISALSADEPALGTADGYVIIRKDQIDDPIAAQNADRIVRRHFG